MKSFRLNLTITALFLAVLFIGCNQPKEFTKDQIPAMTEDITYLASDELEGRLIGTEGEKLAAEYIAKRYTEIGLAGVDGTDSYMQSFDVKPKVNPHSMIQDTVTITGYNIVGLLDNGAEKTVIVGAHYDHLGHGEMGGSLFASSDKEIHNGADDNASGIAGMLAIAERVKFRKHANYNYLFLAFSGEEQGRWGANYFAKNPNLVLDKVAFMVNLDMVGRLDKDNRLAIHGTGTTPAWDMLIDSVLVSDFQIKKHASGVGPSDQTSFYLQDIPVLHFFTGQHENYHRPSDDVELINFTGLEAIVDYVDELLIEMEGLPQPEFVKTKDESRSAPAFKVTLGVIPDYLYNEAGMRIDGVNEGGPAYNAKLQKGDIVIQMGDIEVVDMMSYMKALSVFEKGQTIKVTVKRGEEDVVVDMTF